MRLFPLFSSRLFWQRRRSEAVLAEAAAVARKSGTVTAFRQALPAILRELSRARRYKRPLAFAVVTRTGDHFHEEIVRHFDNGHNGDGNGNGNGAHSRLLTQTSQLASAVFGTILSEALRESDVVTYLATHDRYLILLTESSEVQARETVRRLDQLLYERTRDHLRAGLSQYPKDGLTLEELIGKASTSLTEQVSADLVPSVAGRFE